MARNRPANGDLARNGIHSNSVSEPSVCNGSCSNGSASPCDYDHMQLVDIHSLPKFLADNDYLLRHHRPVIPSITGCIKSSFTWHTETINIWSHVIGCIGTFLLMIHEFTFSSVSFKENVWLLPFFLGAVTCMGCSATYHTFLCYSEPVYKCLAKFDYCGIVVLIVSSFPPWLHFGFYCDRDLRNMYLVLIYSLGALSVFTVLNDGLGKGKNKNYRAVRAGLFMALGLSGLFPGLHYFYVEGFDHMYQYGSWLILMAVWYLVGGSLYAMRIPERLYPGKFDIVMHSHQFLHIFVIMGVASCFVGITKLVQFRQRTNFYCPVDHM